MSDNERRARDLAIFSLSKITPTPEQIEAAAVDGKPIQIDFYKEYKSLYSHLLSLFNCDFPDGK